MKLVAYFRKNVAENVMLAEKYLKSYDIKAEESYFIEAVRGCENANTALGSLPVYDSCKNKYAYMLLEEIGISEFGHIIGKFEQVINMLEKQVPEDYEHKDTIELISMMILLYYRVIAEFESVSSDF